MRVWSLLMLGACGGPSPGVPIDTGAPDATTTVQVPTLNARRLNRAEYDRTLQHLTGLPVTSGRSFPVDDASDGFDVVAEALVVSPLLVELWERTSGLVVSELLDKPLEQAIALRLEPEDGGFSSSAEYGGPSGDAWGLNSGGTLSGPFEVPERGVYRLTFRAWAQQAGEGYVQASLGLGFEGTPTSFDVVGTTWEEATEGSIEVELRPGRHTISLSFDNDLYDPELGYDRNLFVEHFRVEGPLDFVPEANPARAQLMVCEPAEAEDARVCIQDILERFVPKAWRRPVPAAELEGLMAAIVDPVLAAGDRPEWALEFALRAVLTSPHFLFLVEPEVAPGEPINDHVLASRLSYLLWSSMPDARLFELADDGVLHRPEVLEAEVDRMIADPKADAFVEDFAGQWLMIRAVDDAAPDFWFFPGYTPDLRDAMKQSMRLFFADLLREGRPLTDLVESPWLFVDNNLRIALDLPYDQATAGGAFVRMDLGSRSRRGWLTQPGLLTATSYPTRTSPVRRGVWVLSSLLCDEPDPPPPGVESFPEATGELLTVRDRLEAHRNIPACANCHNKIDPVGLAFENFNGMGVWRDVDAGEPVDASGQLPDGTPISGIEDLAAVLADDERFTACAVEKLFTYAHRRAPLPADEVFVHEIEADFLARGGTFRDLLVSVVLSETFRAPGTETTMEVTP